MKKISSFEVGSITLLGKLINSNNLSDEIYNNIIKDLEREAIKQSEAIKIAKHMKNKTPQGLKMLARAKKNGY